MKKGVDYIGVSAGALIFNEKGELFLNKRSQNTRNARGHWEASGGGVEFNETREAAVIREIKEEFGVDIEIIELLHVVDEILTEESQHWVATTFIAKIKDGQTPQIMEPEKCDEIAWFSLDKLPSPLSYITTLDLKAYNNQSKIEMIDVLDDKGSILYKTSKQRAHELGLLHGTVIAELINSKGEWILVKQAGDRQDAGQYVSPVGGHIRSGETEEEALHREALEEIGLEDFKYKHVGNAVFNRDILGRKENHYFIVYEIHSDEIPTLNHESVGYETFSKSELVKQLKDNPEKFGHAFHHLVENFYSDLV